MKDRVLAEQNEKVERLKKNLILVLSTLAVTATASAQSMARPDVTGQLNTIFLQLGFGEFTFEKYLVSVAVSFVSFFCLPYAVARFNGVNRDGANYLGLQGLFGGFLVAGFITAPFGVIVFGRALFNAFYPPASNAR